MSGWKRPSHTKQSRAGERCWPPSLVFLVCLLTSLVGYQLCVLLRSCDVCLRSSVSSCFCLSAFDSAMSWAVGERALQRRFHVPFYVHLRSCATRRLRCFLNRRPLNANWRASSRRNPGPFSTSRKFGVPFKGGLRLMTLGRRRDTLGTWLPSGRRQKLPQTGPFFQRSDQTLGGGQRTRWGAAPPCFRVQRCGVSSASTRCQATDFDQANRATFNVKG